MKFEGIKKGICLLGVLTIFSAAGAEVVPEALPENERFGYGQTRVVNDEYNAGAWEAENPVHMGAGEDYTALEGVLTFRGNNYRDGAAWGTIPENPTALTEVWQVKVGKIDTWAGVGWTGQGAVIRWPEELRKVMNLNEDKKNKEGLTEVIYGALDGKIRFLDLETGEETRPAIQQPASIKGSVSVDPRGIPLLYCGQGLSKAGKKNVKTGLRIYSLVDQSLLYFLDGRDAFAPRRWFAFDASPIVDAGSDTLIEVGENGLAYRVTLNTVWDGTNVSVSPEVVRFKYNAKVARDKGMENSPAVYDHYLYFADNSGLISCVDLNTLRAVWLEEAGDDTDATIVLEEEKDGKVSLYTVNELDKRGLKGNANCRKFDALTGEELWCFDAPCVRRSEDLEGGGFSTPAVGKNQIQDLVYFNIARTKTDGGTIYALNKKTGEVVWQAATGGYSWSSPVCCYDKNGKGYILHGNCVGALRLYDARTGEILAEADLHTNIEGSPVIFEDRVLIGTRGGRIYGLKIE